MTFPSTPARFSKFPPPEYYRHAPILGEHSKEILLELGYSEGEVNQLNEEGVIGIPTPEMFTAKRRQKGTYGTGAMYRGGGQR
jgi:hypothetical protein